jgi:hypothetical protein
MQRRLLSGALILSAIVFVSASNLSALDQFLGVVSDSNCGAKHSTPSDAAASCVKSCIAKGAKYVLVANDGKVLNLDVQDDFAKMDIGRSAGKYAIIGGTLKGQTVQVSEVSEVRLEPASGKGQWWVGHMSDSKCGLKHAEGGIAGAACIKSCVAKGAQYVFVSGGKVYGLEPQNTRILSMFTGPASFTAIFGTLEGNTIHAAKFKTLM